MNKSETFKDLKDLARDQRFNTLGKQFLTSTNFMNNLMSLVENDNNFDEVKIQISTCPDRLYEPLNIDLETLLHYAVKAGAKKNVAYLLSEGANANQKNENDQTPFMYCIIYDKKAFFDLFLTKKIDFSIKDKNNNTALHHVFLTSEGDLRKANSDFLEAIIEKFTQANIDLNPLNNSGFSPLSLAEQAADQKSKKILIDAIEQASISHEERPKNKTRPQLSLEAEKQNASPRAYSTSSMIKEFSCKIDMPEATPESFSYEHLQQKLNFNNRNDLSHPTKASMIGGLSILHNHFIWQGYLATVKELDITQCKQASIDEKHSACEQIIKAVKDALLTYLTIWGQASPHTTREINNTLVTKLETKRTSYVELNGIQLIDFNLEKTVKNIIGFLKNGSGQWNPGKRLKNTSDYQKNNGPSIKVLLMKNLLTIPLFNRKVQNNRITLVTRTEIEHGLEYDLDLTKRNFGGCYISGLICFFENECKRFAGLGQNPRELTETILCQR